MTKPLIAATLALLLVISGLYAQSAAPALASGGILNAADYGRAVAPGTMVAVFGTNLAPRTTAATSVPLPNVLEGVSVEITAGGSTSSAPLFFVSDRQINAQLPFQLSVSSIQIRVRNARGLSGAETVAITPSAPRLFTRSMDGKGEAILLHSSNYALVTESTPAEPGEYLILYLTGLGEVTPAIAAGKPGGDNAGFGPLNRTLNPVTVTLGGRTATPLFAGLAPGFPGVYQVNIQAPADMPVGRPAVEVSAAGSRSQANVWISAAAAAKPEDAVRSALEAQARGDVAAMVAQCEMDRFGDSAKRDALGMLDVIRSQAAFSDLAYTHLATAMGDQGTLAVVRAQVSYVVTINGGRFPENFGILAFVRKVNQSWKVLTFEPDDLLNQEYFEFGGSTSKSTLVRTVEPPDLRTLNRAINEAMKKTYIDQTSLGLDITFGGIGKIPIYGDGIANVYQVVDTLKTGKETIQEYWNNGATPIMTAKVKQVGIGILQIATEAIPPLDSYTDMMKTTMNQWTYTEEVRRALGEFKRVLRQTSLGGLEVKPRLYPLKTFEYPADMEVARDTTVNHSYEQPISAVAFAGPTAIGAHLAFLVVGELEVKSSSLVYPAAKMLGGQLRGDAYYIPVDVGSLVEGDASTGDQILEGYDRHRRATSESRVVSWDSTCRRGVQIVSVRLRNGERAIGFRLLNRYMNNIRELSVPGVPDEGVKLTTGGNRTGLSVMGVPVQGATIDLTGQEQCLAMSIASTSVASMERAKAVNLTAVAPGKTVWRIVLNGSGPEAGIVPVVKEIPVEVTGSKIPPVPYIRVLFSGDHIYSSGKKTFVEVTNALGLELIWTGNRFYVSNSIKDSTGSKTTEIVIDGTVDPEKSTLLTLSFKRVETVTNTSIRETLITVRDIPLNGWGTEDAAWWLSGAALRPLITVKDVSSTLYAGKWTPISEYMQTDWGAGARGQTLDVVLNKNRSRLGIP